MIGKEHIVLVRLSAVGDVVLATPVAARLRQSYPRAEITWLVDPAFRELIAGNPAVDRITVFDHRGKHRGMAGIRRLAKEMGGVDLWVDLQRKLRTVLLASLLKPAERRTLVRRRGMAVLRALVGRDTVLGAPHQVLRNLSVLGLPPLGEELPCPSPTMALSEPVRAKAEEMIACTRHRGPLIGVFCGAAHATKNWPVPHVARFADRCLREGLGVALLGGRREELLVQSIAKAMNTQPTLVHAGGGLAFLAGLLAHCRAVVSPDSGPGHMAAALGVRVVSLFGSTSPQRWAPVGPHCRVVRNQLGCSPCSNHGRARCPLNTMECMWGLDPEKVWEAMTPLLAEPSLKN